MSKVNQIQRKQSQQMKIVKNKPMTYGIKLLIVLFPMAIVPIASYDILIFYFKHSTVIYSSIIFGFMLGLNLLYIGEKVPKIIFRK